MANRQKPTEIAVLVVNGQKFEDWESIWVQKRWAEAFSYFRFTAAERDRAVISSQPLWARLQFKPPDACAITLAGQLAITGYIEVRQVAYDARSHAVMLIGKSATAGPAKSSVDTKDGNFDNMSVEQAARKALAKTGASIKVIGSLNAQPYDKLQNQPGEKIWDFMERIARPRGIIIGSDAQGNFLLIGDHSYPVEGQLIEGINIKQCQAVFNYEHTYSTF